MPHDTPSRRDILLAQEARLVVALADVRSDLNRLVPISVLPAEIFEHIFSTCISWLTHYPKRSSQRPEHPLAWTHVCRAWRTLALDCPRLWQNIDLFALNTQLALTFLDRSKSSPISISAAYRLGTHTQRSSHIFLAFQPHAPRLSSIDLSLFPDDIHVFFECVPWSDLTNVSSLSLKVPPVSANFRLEFPEPLPKLNKLTLDGVALPWNTCFQDGTLSHLSLSGLTADFSPTITQLHSIFRLSSGLQYICLENISPSEWDGDVAAEGLVPVELSKLQELVLTFAKAPVLASLLSLISTDANSSPPSIQLSSPSFKGIDGLLPIDHLASLGFTLRLGKQLTKVIRTDSPAWTESTTDILLSLTSPQSSTRSTSPSPARNGLPNIDHPHLRFLLSPTLQLLLANLTSLELSMSALGPAPSTLPDPSGRMNLIQRKFSSSPPSTRIIYSSSAPQVTQTELQHFLSHTPNLQSIHVALNDIDGLLYALLRPSSSSSGKPNPTFPYPYPNPPTTDILCPKLTSLHFGSPGYLWYNFFTPSTTPTHHPSSTSGEPDDDNDEPPNWLHLLHTIISQRLYLSSSPTPTSSNSSSTGILPISLLSFKRCEGITRSVVEDTFSNLAHPSSSSSSSLTAAAPLVIDILEQPDTGTAAQTGDSSVLSSSSSSGSNSAHSKFALGSRSQGATSLLRDDISSSSSSSSTATPAGITNGLAISGRRHGSSSSAAAAPAAWSWWEQR